jgi:hypothetical protein
MRTLGRRIHDTLRQARPARSVAALALVVGVSDGLRSIIEEIRQGTEASIRKSLSRFAQENKRILDELRVFVQSIKAGETDDEEGDEEEEEADDLAAPAEREFAFQAYLRAVQALARARVGGRRLRPTSRNGRIIEWLGERIPSKEDLATLGSELMAEQSARVILGAPRRYVFGIPRLYRQFRRARQEEGNWYVATTRIRGKSFRWSWT